MGPSLPIFALDGLCYCTRNCKVLVRCFPWATSLPAALHMAKCKAKEKKLKVEDVHIRITASHFQYHMRQTSGGNSDPSLSQTSALSCSWPKQKFCSPSPHSSPRPSSAPRIMDGDYAGLRAALRADVNINLSTTARFRLPPLRIHTTMSPRSFSLQHPQVGNPQLDVKKVDSPACTEDGEETGGEASCHSAGAGSSSPGGDELKHQPLRVAAWLAERETCVANSSTPLAFKCLTASATKEKCDHAPPDSGAEPRRRHELWIQSKNRRVEASYYLPFPCRPSNPLLPYVAKPHFYYVMFLDFVRWQCKSNAH